MVLATAVRAQIARQITGTTATESSVNRDLRRRTALLLIAAHVLFAIVAVYSLWFATHFTFRFEQLHLLDNFREQANGFFHGTLQMSGDSGTPLARCLDCDTYHNKAFLAYEPFPSIFQLILVNVLGLAISTEAIVWGICAATLYSAFWIVRWYARAVLNILDARAILIASFCILALGVSDIYLHTSTIAFFWFQAAATGTLCTLWSAFFLIRALHRRAYRGLVWSGILCALAFLSKQNYIPACLAGAVLIWWTARTENWSWRETVARLARFALPVIAGAIIMLWFNWARFGNPLNTGIQYINADEQHPNVTEIPRWHRIPYNLYNEFLAGVDFRTSDFPFVHGRSLNFGGVKPDGSGGLQHDFAMFSMFISFPMFLLLFVGAAYFIRALMKRQISPQWRYWAFLLLLAASVFFLYLRQNGSWLRYQYDILFLLAICTVQVTVRIWRRAARFQSRSLRIALQFSLCAFLFVCFCEQAALGLDQTAGVLLTNDSKFAWSTGFERDTDWRRRARAQALRSLLFDHPFRNVSANHGAVSFALNAKIPSARPGTSEPLLQAGSTPGSSEMIGIKYLSDGKFNLFLDHWGAAPCSSDALTPSAGTQRIDTIFEPKFGIVLVELNGSIVLDCSVGVYANALGTAVIGKNTLGFSTAGPSFSGSVEPPQTVPSR